MLEAGGEFGVAGIDFRQKRRMIDRLRQDDPGPCINDLPLGCGIVEGGNHDDGRELRQFDEAFDNILATSARHMEVEENDRLRAWVVRVQEGLARVERVDVKPFHFQKELEGFPYGFIVVDYGYIHAVTGSLERDGLDIIAGFVRVPLIQIMLGRYVLLPLTPAARASRTSSGKL